MAEHIIHNLGAVFAIGLTAAGSAYATAQKARYILNGETPGSGYNALEDKTPEPSNNSSVPLVSWVGVIIAGMPVIYGLIIAVMILSHRGDLTIAVSMKSMAAGLAVGLAGLFSCYAIGNISERTKPKAAILLNIY